MINASLSFEKEGSIHLTLHPGEPHEKALLNILITKGSFKPNPDGSCTLVISPEGRDEP